MMEFQIWAEKFLLYCYPWDRRAESVPHPLYVVPHPLSIYLSLSMFVYVILSLCLDHGHLICIWRGFVFFFKKINK